MLRFSLALALVTAASAAQDPGATPAKFEFRPLKAGETTQIKVESTFELDIVTRSLQEPDAVSTRQLSFVRTLECLQTAQSEGGLLVSVATAKLQRSGTNIAPVTETSEIENKSYVVVSTDKGRTVKSESGEPAPADASGLGAWEDFGTLLPKADAKEGAPWTVDAAAIASLVSIPDLATPAGTFEAKIEGSTEGRTTVFFSGSLEGKTTKGFDTKLKIAEGRLVFDAATGRPVSLAITGSFEATKDINQKVSRQKELRQVDEKVGDVKVTSRKLEVKAEFK
jgi:hypothetical protein